MGLALMGLEIKINLQFFFPKMIRSKNDFIESQKWPILSIPKTLDAANFFPNPWAPVQRTWRDYGQITLLYFLDFWFVANPIGANPIRGSQKKGFGMQLIRTSTGAKCRIFKASSMRHIALGHMGPWLSWKTLYVFTVGFLSRERGQDNGVM